jgi:hypothetical protein
VSKSEFELRLEKRLESTGRWQVVTIDCLKYYQGPPCQTPLCPAGGPPLKGLMVVSGVAQPQGGLLAAVFYPFGYPTPYAHVGIEIDTR